MLKPALSGKKKQTKEHALKQDKKVGKGSKKAPPLSLPRQGYRQKKNQAKRRARDYVRHGKAWPFKFCSGKAGKRDMKKAEKGAALSEEERKEKKEWKRRMTHQCPLSSSCFASFSKKKKDLDGGG